MKTSRLKASVAALLFLVSSTGIKAAAVAPVVPMSRFECLRALMPITDRGSFQALRKGVESPFFIRDKYIVFPQITATRVSGFYVFDGPHAWFYDSVEDRSSHVQQALLDLKADSSQGILELTAQPNGLETVSISYLPGYNPQGSDNNGPAILGSSVLPVVGAFVSRPDIRRVSYFDPTLGSNSSLELWMSDHGLTRRAPADIGTGSQAMIIPRTILRLATAHPKTGAALWSPVLSELKIRRDWVREHNLDEAMFKKVSQVIDHCPL